MRADEMLRSDIVAELSYDPRLRGAHIEVSVAGGATVLRGHVGSYEQKIAAERAAQRVRGVRAVAAELRIASAPDAKVEDPEIAKRIASLLTWNASVPSGVSAIVDQGWVTLSGLAEWNYQRQSAESLVRALGGVIGVSNNILVKPQPTPTDVRERIEAALLRDARLDAGAIKIGVTGPVVTLSGKVSTLHERLAAEHAAWSAPGVTEVRNQIVLA
jgi:osmotically-inducible protein OsmY